MIKLNPQPQKEIEKYIYTWHYKGLRKIAGEHKVIGEKLYHEAGKGKEAQYIHPIVAAMVNSHGKYLLQLRSSKITNPLKYDFSTAGHVNYENSSLEEAIQEESGEELGTYLKNPVLFNEKPFIIKANLKHRIFIFHAKGTQGKINPGVEVKRVEWLTEKQIHEINSKPYSKAEVKELMNEGYSKEKIAEFEQKGRLTSGLQFYFEKIAGMKF